MSYSLNSLKKRAYIGDQIGEHYGAYTIHGDTRGLDPKP